MPYNLIIFCFHYSLRQLFIKKTSLFEIILYKSKYYEEIVMVVIGIRLINNKSVINLDQDIFLYNNNIEFIEISSKNVVIKYLKR